MDKSIHISLIKINNFKLVRIFSIKFEIIFAIVIKNYFSKLISQDWYSLQFVRINNNSN